MHENEVLVAVAYSALTIATNCAQALGEHKLLTPDNAEATVGEIKRLARILDDYQQQELGQNAPPSVAAVRLQAAAQALENLSRRD